MIRARVCAGALARTKCARALGPKEHSDAAESDGFTGVATVTLRNVMVLQQ